MFLNIKIILSNISRNYRILILCIILGTSLDLLIKVVVVSNLRYIPSVFDSNVFNYIKTLPGIDTDFLDQYFEFNRENNTYSLLSITEAQKHHLWKKIRKLNYDKTIIINNMIRLKYEINEDVGFSLFRNLNRIMSDSVKWIFISSLQCIVILFFLLYFIFTKKSIFTVPLSLVISGALGNLIDRLFRGYVVDYIELTIPWIPYKLFNPWPIFNLADVLTVTGICLFIWALLIDSKEDL